MSKFKFGDKLKIKGQPNSRLIFMDYSPRNPLDNDFTLAFAKVVGSDGSNSRIRHEPFYIPLDELVVVDEF